jgi:hypothetical protein
MTDIRVILGNLNYLKKRVYPAEFRVNRDQAFKDINHPFYYIKYKEKEVAIIGTAE